MTRVTYDADLAPRGMLRIDDRRALDGKECELLAREVGGFEERKAARLAAALAYTPSAGLSAA